MVQVNGKVRGKFEAAADAEEAKIQEQALQLENVQHQLEGKTVRKVIVVKGKVVNNCCELAQAALRCSFFYGKKTYEININYEKYM